MLLNVLYHLVPKRESGSLSVKVHVSMTTALFSHLPLLFGCVNVVWVVVNVAMIVVSVNVLFGVNVPV